MARELEDLLAGAERLTIPDYHPVLDLTETETRRESIRTAIEHLADFVREARRLRRHPTQSTRQARIPCLRL